MKKLNWFVFLLIVMTLSVSLIIACNNDDDEDDDEDSDADDDSADDDSADDDSADDDSADDDDATDDDDDTTDDDDDSTTTCTLTDICTYMYDKCPDHDGFQSIDDCKSAWFDLCFGTLDEVNYMLCVCDCFDPVDSCDDFFDYCELDCWETYCDYEV